MITSQVGWPRSIPRLEPIPMPDLDDVFAGLDRLRIELPSWGFADTGTRFGKYLQDDDTRRDRNRRGFAKR